MADANFMTGSNGLIAVDKVGNQVLFLDPISYETVLVLDGFAPRVHELLVAPDGGTAYVPIYGDGIHGKNWTKFGSHVRTRATTGPPGPRGRTMKTLSTQRISGRRTSETMRAPAPALLR